MNEQQSILVSNLLNGVAVGEAARAAGMGEEAAMQLFLDVMRAVEEYQVIHCMPFFGCRTLGEAMRNRMSVFHALQAIERWDEIERPFMLDLLKRKGVEIHGLDRAEQEAIVRRTMMALAHYLPPAKLKEFERGRVKWAMAHPAECIAAMERFVSLTEPHVLKNVKHFMGDNGSTFGVVMQAAGELPSRGSF
ncbi:MAG TPA: hypothetical protein VN667_17925 [Burkholderiales bacterium]|nr:hypothetical protein [Burkholderiales bacterium]